MKSSDLLSAEVSPPKRQRLAYETAKRTSLFEMTMTDDLFLYLLTFFVQPTVSVADGFTIRSMSCVCKDWCEAINDPSIWKSGIPIGIIRDDTAVSPDTRGLIGFRKLGRLRGIWPDSLVFRVEERATREPYVVRIVKEALRESKGLLRDMRMTGDLLRAEEIQGAPNHCDFLALPLRFEANDTSTTIWYNHFDQTLEEWFSNHDKCLTDWNATIPTTLPIPLEKLKFWMKSLLSAIEAIHKSIKWTKFSFDGASDTSNRFSLTIRPDNITVDTKTSLLRLCLPDKLVGDAAEVDKWTFPEAIERENSENSQLHFVTRKQSTFSRCPDLWSAGCIMAQVARSGLPIFRYFGSNRFSPLIGEVLPTLADPQATQTKQLRNELPMLDDSGFACLLNFFKEKGPGQALAKDKSVRHPFLAHASTSLISGTASLKAFYSRVPVDPNRVHATLNHWASVADWIFEACEVFDLKSDTAYQSMAYFDIYISSTQSVLPSSYQLIAGACLLLATKTYPARLSAVLSPEDIAFSADNSFMAGDVKKAEQSAALLLSKRVHPYSDYYSICCRYLDSYWSLRSMSQYVTFLNRAAYVADMAQYTEAYLSYEPEKIGAAVCVISLYRIGHDPLWPPSAEAESGYKLQDLQGVVTQILGDIERLRNVRPALRVVLRKHMHLTLDFPTTLVLT